MWASPGCPAVRVRSRHCTPMSSTSNSRSELGGIIPGIPVLPHAALALIRTVAISPRESCATPASQPGTTCSHRSLNFSGRLRLYVLSKILPSAKQRGRGQDKGTGGWRTEAGTTAVWHRSPNTRHAATNLAACRCSAPSPSARASGTAAHHQHGWSRPGRGEGHRQLSGTTSGRRGISLRTHLHISVAELGHGVAPDAVHQRFGYRALVCAVKRALLYPWPIDGKTATVPPRNLQRVKSGSVGSPVKMYWICAVRPAVLPHL